MLEAAQKAFLFAALAFAAVFIVALVVIFASQSPTNRSGFSAAWISDEKVIAGVGTIFTGLLAFATLFLFFATRNLVSDARDTAQRQLRAYVYAEVVPSKYKAKPDEPWIWAISIFLKNTGQTWARNVVVFKSVVPREFGKRDYDPWDRAKWNDDDADPTTLGPGQTRTLQFHTIDPADIPSYVEGAEKRVGIDFVVHVEYEDTVSDPSVIHQTQVAQRFRADGQGAVSLDFLPKHNCVDNDCPEGGRPKL
jgi:hypothetical protein